MASSKLNLSGVRSAYGRLRSVAVVTPLIENKVLNHIAGARILLKAESLQRTGTFKFRGAYNAISQLSADELKKGVVACSSGNHAQGVAEAARLMDAQATIVMPSDTPDIKVEGVKRSGGQIRFYDRVDEDREEIALEISKTTGASFIHPYNDTHVILGQGTACLEALKQAAQIKVKPDVVLCGLGGGGIMAGTCVVANSLLENPHCIGVEPEGHDDHRVSLANNAITPNKEGVRSICDALLANEPGEYSFSVNRKLLSSVLTVSDEKVLIAMAFALKHLKLVLEPGGAVSLAAILAGKQNLKQGQSALVILTGGNVDDPVLKQSISYWDRV